MREETLAGAQEIERSILDVAARMGEWDSPDADEVLRQLGLDPASAWEAAEHVVAAAAELLEEPSAETVTLAQYALIAGLMAGLRLAESQSREA